MFLKALDLQSSAKLKKINYILYSNLLFYNLRIILIIISCLLFLRQNFKCKYTKCIYNVMLLKQVPGNFVLIDINLIKWHLTDWNETQSVELCNYSIIALSFRPSHPQTYRIYSIIWSQAALITTILFKFSHTKSLNHLFLTVINMFSLFISLSLPLRRPIDTCNKQSAESQWELIPWHGDLWKSRMSLMG